jgi:hypothetical protein
MLGCVAVLAVIMAVVPPRSAAAFVMLFVACPIAAVVCLCKESASIRVAAWVCSFYPAALLSSLYATWLTAWFELGHCPRVYLDDPKFIGPIVKVPYIVTWILLRQFIAASKISVVLILASVGRLLARRKSLDRVAALLILLPFVAWVLSVALIRWDPGYVYYWFLD